MLDVYIDSEVLRKVSTRIRGNIDRDFESSALKFLRSSCNLFYNEKIIAGRTLPPNFLMLFTESRGNTSKFRSVKMDIETIKKARSCSLFILDEDNDIAELIKNEFANSVGYYEDILNEFLYLDKSQRKIYSIKNSLNERIDIVKSANKFIGWKSLEGKSILPLNDVVVVDKWFLRPSKMYRNYEEFAELSFLPLVQLFCKHSISESINLTVFSVFEEDESWVKPDECFEIIQDYLEDLEIVVNLSIIFSYGLKNWHERYIYMNYMGIDPKLSIHGFRYDNVIGNEDRFVINPYAVEVDTHEIDLEKLRELSVVMQNKNTLIYGNGVNRLLNKILE